MVELAEYSSNYLTTVFLSVCLSAVTVSPSSCCFIDYQGICRKLLGQTESDCSDSVEAEMKDERSNVYNDLPRAGVRW